MRRLTIEFIKSEFEREGYKLLTDFYVNNRQRLDYVCPNGHSHRIRWNDFKRGRRCKYCANKILGDTRRLDFDYIKKSFEKEGYKVLTTQYKNCEQKLDYICSDGHRRAMSWHNWNSGWRCPVCRDKKLSIMFFGPGSHRWKGGISCEPYCDVWLDKDFKESIRERDNYICQNPDCWQRNGKTKTLSIHHIDYNKKNCKPSNLITVCRSCNSRANHNRDWHKSWYQAIMKKKNNKEELIKCLQ